MYKFYIIKCINFDSGVRGYVYDSPTGIKIVTGGILASITQFPNYAAAQEFMRKNKLETSGTKAYIMDNEQLIKEEKNSTGMYVATKDVFFLEDLTGAKCFYDPKLEGYFFQKKDVGYLCWETEEQLRTFVTAMQFPYQTVIKKFEIKK